MLSSGGVRRRGHGRAPRLLDGPVRPRGRRGGCGPDGGAGRRAGDAVGLDMGGTSCDVSLSPWRRARRWDTGREVGGRALALPMVDVHTVGAGGGSIAWRDAGGALRVGPRSAGADPGPACYGRGGDRADGHRRQPRARLPRRRTRRWPAACGSTASAARAGARRAGRRARDCRARGGRGAGSPAWPSTEMAQAVRVVTVERGDRPARAGAGGVRRRRAAARRRASRTSWAWDGWSRRARRGAVGARAGGLRAPPRPGRERAADRRRADAPSRGGGRPRARRARPRGARRAGRRAAGDLRPALRRARRSSCPWTAPLEPDPAELRRAFDARPRGALRLLAIPTPSSSW